MSVLTAENTHILIDDVHVGTLCGADRPAVTPDAAEQSDCGRCKQLHAARTEIPGQQSLFDTLEDLQAQLLKTEGDNLAMAEELGRHGAVIDPRVTIMVRVGALVDALLPDPLQRTRHELDFHTRMADVLRQALAERSRANLTAGLHLPGANPAGPGGLIVPPGT